MIDTTLGDILKHEQDRQANEIEMIASENYVSNDVLHAYANIFTNKYSEGYAGARWYGGNQNVDDLERLTQHRALRMFGLLETSNEENIMNDLAGSTRGVNVQPLSGSPANLAVYMGVLKPGDTVLAMDLNAGGHLSHGHKLNASALYYNFVPYGVKPETFEIDYDEIRSKALDLKPAMIIAGFSAYPKSLDWKRFAAIADEVSEIHGYRPLLMADIAHIAGLIAGEAIPGPFPYFDIVTTTTHKTLRGPRGALIYYTKKDGLDLEKKVNRGVFPGVQGGPHEHEIFAKAVAFNEVLQPSFRNYAKKTIENAKVLASELVKLGWNVLTGTTENHIVMMDVTKRNDADTGLTGKIAEKVLEDIGISVNKNVLPFDTRSPADPSGLRLGTPALTTRRMGIDDVKQIAGIISRGLESYQDAAVLASLKAEVKALCNKYPLRY